MTVLSVVYPRTECCIPQNSIMNLDVLSVIPSGMSENIIIYNCRPVDGPIPVNMVKTGCDGELCGMESWVWWRTGCDRELLRAGCDGEMVVMMSYWELGVIESGCDGELGVIGSYRELGVMERSVWWWTIESWMWWRAGCDGELLRDGCDRELGLKVNYWKLGVM